MQEKELCPDKHYLIIGAGKTGLSCYHFLKSKHIACTITDTRKNPPALEGMTDIPFYPGLPLALLKHTQVIILSPGVSPTLPFLQQAMAQKIPVLTDISLFMQQVRVPVIGITGTNGKSTVTTLVGDILKAAGHRVCLAGNIGEPVLSAWMQFENEIDFYVVELSSFQLETTPSIVLEVGCILNITPDHLDRHANFQQYKSCKQRIYQQARYKVYNALDKHTAPTQKDTQSISFATQKPEMENMIGVDREEGAVWCLEGKKKLFHIPENKSLSGKNGLLNITAATAIARSLGVTSSAIETAVKHFIGLPHRCQWLGQYKGFYIINDSKGTNVGATLSAMKSLKSQLPQKIVLLLGGQAKGGDFTMLRPVLEEQIRAVMVYGEDADKIYQDLQGIETALQKTNTLASAIDFAIEHAQFGDAIVLSPACASWDQFQNYQERGKYFEQYIKARLATVERTDHSVARC